MEAKLTEEDVYYLCKLAILEYLTSGITANFDMYFDAGADRAGFCGLWVLYGDLFRRMNDSASAWRRGGKL